MILNVEKRNDGILLALMLAYCAAGLLHFVHNAVYLREYPNLPSWLTSAGVYAAWCVVTAVGAIGYWLHCRVSRMVGLVTISVYCVLGFAGLDHYVVAPISAHSAMMNLSIWVEVMAAIALLIHALRSILTIRKQRC
jgi:uncharacterized membrane protein